MVATVARPLIIGWAGTAKNTGKTTALLAFLEEAYRQGMCVGLTSIGLDGEIRDQVTGLAKPRLFLEEGTLVATAKDCLEASTVKVAFAQKTGISTALGEVMIARIVQPGYLILAGPSKTEEVQMVSRMLLSMGANIVLVDGALGRIVPFAIADSWVLATGAARSTDILELADEVRAVQEILSLPQAWAESPASSKILVMPNPFNIKEAIPLEVGSILDDQAVVQLFHSLPLEPKAIWIPGTVNARLLSDLILMVYQRDGGFPHTFWFHNPFHLLAGGQAKAVMAMLQNLHATGGAAVISHQVPLLGVTVNPFFPDFQKHNRQYSANTIDDHQLLTTIQNTVSLPVVDVKKSGVAPLWERYRQSLVS